MNNHRSAISAFHEQIQGKPVGEHPRVCALLAGIFNSRPPKPKYCFIWNVQTVIEFIRKEWGRNQELSDKFLTYKLTMLMALASSSHAVDMKHLRDHTFMTSKKNVQFLHPLPTFSVCPNGSESGETPHPCKSNLRLPTTSTPEPPPLPSPLVFLQKIGMLKGKPKCCLKPVCREHL